MQWYCKRSDVFETAVLAVLLTCININGVGAYSSWHQLCNMSMLGVQVSYRSYWTRVLLDLLREHRHHLSIKDIAELTAIRTDDIVKTLESLGLIKYWKGDHIISVTPRIIEEHMRTAAAQKTIGIDTGRLHWTPYVVSPANAKK